MQTSWADDECSFGLPEHLSALYHERLFCVKGFAKAREKVDFVGD